MLKLFARWWAKLSYLWTLEVEAAKSDVNAAVVLRNAGEKRSLIEQLTGEADALEANIAKVEAEEETRKKTEAYQKLTAQEKYEDERSSKKEKDDALQMAAEKRKLAAQEQENVSNGENTAKSLKGMAANSRAFADKIRQI